MRDLDRDLHLPLGGYQVLGREFNELIPIYELVQAQDLLQLLDRPLLRPPLQEAGQGFKGLQRREHDQEGFHVERRQPGLDPQLDVSGARATPEDRLGLAVEVIRRSGLQVPGTGPANHQEEEWRHRRQEVSL